MANLPLIQAPPSRKYVCSLQNLFPHLHPVQPDPQPQLPRIYRKHGHQDLLRLPVDWPQVQLRHQRQGHLQGGELCPYVTPPFTEVHLNHLVHIDIGLPSLPINADLTASQLAPAASTSPSTTTSSPRPLRTSALSALARRASATLAPSSTVSSLSSCSRVVTSPVVT